MNRDRNMIEGNLLIRASAGTGKTFALATRFIRLMLFDKVDPGRIVALTFSRAAAQEIYAKLLERLWQAAESPEKAEEEHQNLIRGLRDETVAAVARRGIRWTPETFAELLRKVVAVQHLGAIATLDSFILRLVGNFPLEMGFQNALKVLDPTDEQDEVTRAATAILGRTHDPDAFAEAFRAAKKGCFSRLCAKTLGEMMEREGWRKFILEHPECKEWTVATMTRALGLEAFAGFADVSATATGRISDETIADAKARTWLKKFKDYLVSVVPGDNPVPGGAKTIAVEFARAVVRHPNAPYVEHVSRGKDGAESCVQCEFPAAVFAAARADLRRLAGAFLRRQLEIVEAKIRLFSIIEKEYDAMTRRAGKLTFRDFTNAAKDNAKIELDNLRFRFDAKLDHWALDEFQDTSEVQWACLRELVESAASGGGSEPRSVIAVGDLKQSIYTWRGGDDKPFEEMMSWPWFGTDADGTTYGRIENSKTSYRYGKRIADFINRVFGARNVRESELFGERAAAVTRWLAEDCWLEHVPQFGQDGQPKVRDYVKVVGVCPNADADTDADDAILAALHRELEPVWHARADAGSDETIGVLVRRNEDGAKIAEYLRKKGLPAVWEGVNAVSDVPAVQGVLMLLKLSEHPKDTFAWTAVDRLLPVREMLMPEATTVESVSARVSESLSHQGLARTLKDYCGALCREANGLDNLSRLRLRALVRLGVDYERHKSSDYGVDDFARFVGAAGKRTQALSADVIRILSIHRSKGLTLDRVFVPLFEGDKSSIVEPTPFSALFGRGRAWVLPHLSPDIAALNDETRAVLDEQRDARLLEQLRLHYVALTRSRKALYVLFSQEAHNGTLFRDLVMKSIAGVARHPCASGTVLFEDGDVPAFAVARNSVNATPPWGHEAADVRIQRRSPSRLTHGRAVLAHRSPATADVLFAGEYGVAARRGVDAHAEYAKIEWANAEALAKLPSGFRPAFALPGEGASVWRERSYELFAGNCWETGQFDRVVFEDGSAGRAATIYDFKTNARETGEDDAAFVQRMVVLYAPQMEAYRRALSSLTGIPTSRIKATLLLTANGQAAPVFT